MDIQDNLYSFFLNWENIPVKWTKTYFLSSHCFLELQARRKSHAGRNLIVIIASGILVLSRMSDLKWVCSSQNIYVYIGIRSLNNASDVCLMIWKLYGMNVTVLPEDYVRDQFLIWPWTLRVEGVWRGRFIDPSSTRVKCHSISALLSLRVLVKFNHLSEEFFQKKEEIYCILCRTGFADPE